MPDPTLTQLIQWIIGLSDENQQLLARVRELEAELVTPRARRPKKPAS